MRLLMRLFWVWIANAIALAIAARLFEKVTVDDFWALVLAAFVFGVVNTLIKPIVIVLGLPLIIVTLGLALFAINMLMLWLTEVLVGGFTVDGFWTFVGATLVIWLVNYLLEYVPPFRR